MLFQKKNIFEPREQNPPVLSHMHKLTDLVIGGSGIGAVELVNNVGIPDVTQGSSLISVIVQLAIGVVTLIGLLRKKRV